MATMYDPPHLGEWRIDSGEYRSGRVDSERDGGAAEHKPGDDVAGAERARQRFGGAGAGAGTDRLERRRTLDADASDLRCGARATEAGGVAARVGIPLVAAAMQALIAMDPSVPCEVVAGRAHQYRRGAGWNVSVSPKSVPRTSSQDFRPLAASATRAGVNGR